MIFLRVLSYNDEYPYPILGQYLKWDDEWDGYVLEVDLQERPNVWKLIDSILNNGFKFSQFDIIQDFWQNYDFLICIEIEIEME